MGVLLSQRGLYTFLGVCLSYSQLVILRFGAKAAGVEDKRIDYTPPSDTIRDLLATLPRE